MRKRQPVSVSNNQYRVVGADGVHKDIEASTAYEAFKLSGLSHAIKIERLANARLLVVGQSYFLAETPPISAQSSEENIDPAKLLRNAVLSANDMDRIMRSFQQAALREEAEKALQQQPATSASGTEVHNDGFDEIIPANSGAAKAAEKAAAVLVAEPKAEIAASGPEAPPAPQKALSPEEVNKLLNESKQ